MDPNKRKAKSVTTTDASKAVRHTDQDGTDEFRAIHSFDTRARAPTSQLACQIRSACCIGKGRNLPRTIHCAGGITQTFPATGCTALLRGPFDPRHLPLHLRLHRHLLRAHFGARRPPDIVRPKAALVLAALLAAVFARARNTEVLALITPADLLDLPLLGLGNADLSHTGPAAAHIALPIVAVRRLVCRARILCGG